MSNEVAITSGIDVLIKRRLITAVHRTVKSGKDATVYRCHAHPDTGEEVLALKVHRPILHRAFRHDAPYQQGRVCADARMERAFQNGSRFGREVQAARWIGAEYETLRLLHRAGASVPAPIALVDDLLLMQWIGDSEPAPTLHRVRMSTQEAEACLHQVLDQIALWLRHDRVHGDLSAYNILVRNRAPVLIDAPQAVDPRRNDLAYALLVRDLENCGRYFSRYGLPLDAGAQAHALWRRWQRGTLQQE